MKIPSLILIFTLLFSHQATSFDRNGEAMYYNGLKCADYVAAYQKEQASDSGYAAWDFVEHKYFIRGFLSAFNLYKDNGISDIRKGFGEKNILFFIDKHCRENPLDGVLDGIWAFLIEVCYEKQTAVPGDYCYSQTKHLNF
tara:strand:- start:218 stop:640 length:423 start_codon:yes stop_codon:yes gene_type:complete